MHEDLNSILIKKKKKPDVEVYSCNPSTAEAEADGSLELASQPA